MRNDPARLQSTGTIRAQLPYTRGCFRRFDCYEEETGYDPSSDFGFSRGEEGLSLCGLKVTDFRILHDLQRFVAMICEHFAGKWPFWISPRQVVVLPVAASHKAYAQEVAQLLWDQGLYAEADLSDFTLNKRIRNAEISQVSQLLS